MVATTPGKEAYPMAFGFFSRRKKKNKDKNPNENSAVPAHSEDSPQEVFEGNGRQVGDPIEQQVDRDAKGRLTAADFLPDADLPQP